MRIQRQNNNKSHSKRWVRSISPLLLLFAGTLSACSTISIPLGDSTPQSGQNATLAKNIKLEQPLPKALAYSDAAVIGQVAGKAAFDNVEKDRIDWVNSVTGSVGTWKAGPQVDYRDQDCRAFGATVTSVGGVHRFSGVACRDENGDVAVKSLSDKAIGEEAVTGAEPTPEG